MPKAKKKTKPKPAIKTKTTKPAAAKSASKRTSHACDGRCRVCGDVCVRAGLHEQHRCSDHFGVSA